MRDLGQSEPLESFDSPFHHTVANTRNGRKPRNEVRSCVLDRTGQRPYEAHRMGA